MPIKFDLSVEGLCAERQNTRLIKTKGKEFGKEVETTTTKSEEIEEKEYSKEEGGKKKAETKKVKGTVTVWIHPPDNMLEELKAFIKAKTEFCLGATISNQIRAMNTKKPPPSGTYGLGKVLRNTKRVVKVILEDIEVGVVKRNQRVQIHGIRGRFGNTGASVPEYADTVSFTAKAKVESMIEDYKGGDDLLKRVLEYLSENAHIGAFHNSGNGKVKMEL